MEEDDAGLVGTLRQLRLLTAENERLRDALEGMCYQFGHDYERDGRRYLGTMGLSNLEDAFELLGWDDPHPLPADEATQAGQR